MPAGIVSDSKTRFTRRLIEINRLDPDDFQSWAFCPGMLFGSPDKWWGDLGRRDFPHEGLDFCLYKDSTQRVLRLDHRTRIPVIHAGVVRALFTDYLGKAVVVEHEHLPGEHGKIVSVYAHTKPLDQIQPGSVVADGEVIATIADTSRSKARILPHLHLSLGRPSKMLVYEEFVWNMMRDPSLVSLLDPQAVIGGSFQVLEARDHRCRRPTDF